MPLCSPTKLKWQRICRKLSIMKFSYRITAIGLLCATVVVVFFTWGNDMIMWDDTSHLATKQKPLPFTQHPNKEVKFRGPVVQEKVVASSVPPQLHYNQDMCTFSDMAAAQVDVDTLDILKLVNKGKTPLLDAPRSLKAVEQQLPNFEGYKSPNGLPLKVIVVPHSHSDPGWHKTVNGYFEAQTRHTLNNMVDKLVKYPKMTFIWAESVFLSLWWQDLEPQMQDTVRALIRRGQLEIVVGSWVVPDEANPHYFALIDQMIEGNQWLEENIGVKPKNVWTLDPFGYSSTLPYLYQKAGYENMVILRVHERVKAALQASKALEFNWRQHWDHAGRSEMFTLMMPYKLYNIKHSCGPDPEVCIQFDFRRIPGEVSEGRSTYITDDNVARQAKLLLSQYMSKSSLFKHNVVLVPIGDDFRFDRNIEWDQQYENYQKLFDYINSQKDWNIHAQFGTIQTYFDEVKNTMRVLNSSTNEYFPRLSGDFFPYTDQNNEYWTGYFTTRPFDKTLGRELEVNLRGAEIINSLAAAMALRTKSSFVNYGTNLQELSTARQDLALFQHHDGITGTERSWVAVDYEERLNHGLGVARDVLRRSISYILAKDKKHQADIEEKLTVRPTRSQRIVVPINGRVELPTEMSLELVLYNSVGRAKQELVQLYVDVDNVEVSDDQGNVITSQINPVWTPKNTISITTFELVFVADLPALSLVTYFIRQVPKGQKSKSNYISYIRLYNHQGYKVPQETRFQVRPPVGQGIVLENEAFKARFSATTGYLQSITTKPVVKTSRVELSFLMYKSRMSGAYIFGPAGPAVDTELEPKPMIRVVRGPVVSEVQVIQELVNHTARMCNVSGPLGAALEINNIVDLREMDEKEMIMHINTDIENFNGSFYTDQNGFQTMKRQRFEHFPTEANYYPFTSHAYMEDSTGRFSVLSAQPLGVGSQDKGSLEVMLDRRLTYDDMRGLGEGVLDNKRTPSRFFFLLERPSNSLLAKRNSDSPRPSAPLLSHPSLTAQLLVEDLRHYAVQMLGNFDTAATYTRHEFLTSSLPCDVLLTNLRALPSDSRLNTTTSAALLLHRLAYTCDYPTRGVHCTQPAGQKTTVALNALFKDVQVKEATETTLSLMHNRRTLRDTDKFKVYLDPMELYTYRLNFG